MVNRLNLFCLGLLTAGWVAIWRLKPPLYHDSHAIGLHATGLLVPYVAAVAFAAVALLSGKLDRVRVLMTAGLFLLLALSFADLFTSPIIHLWGDDSGRYSIYAHNMLKEHTLWGGDILVRGGGRYYVDQPGYRYYLAAIIGLLGGEHRGLQLFNMGVLLSVVLWTMQVINQRLGYRAASVFAVFALASAPYVSKNVIYGYTEWFVVALFMIAACALLTRRLVLGIVALALVPFIRQNLLLISPVIAAFTILTTRKWFLIVPYLLLLALPLYHNLYYAGEWRFLIENRGPMVLEPGKLLHYAGIDLHEKLLVNLIALMFAPLGTGLIGYYFIKSGRLWWFFALIIGLTAGPTLLFGSSSFPRFEYVNQWVILLSFWVVLWYTENQSAPMAAAPLNGGPKAATA